MKKYLALVLLVCYSLSVWANASAYLLCSQPNQEAASAQCCCSKNPKKACANQCSLSKTDLTGVISSLPDFGSDKYVLGYFSPVAHLSYFFNQYFLMNNNGLSRWDKLYFLIEKIPKYLLYRVLII